MIIDNLPTIPSAVTAGDELAVERGTTTYKVDYNALAAAILAQAVSRTSTPVTFGGSEANFAANLVTLLNSMSITESKIISVSANAGTDNFVNGATYYGFIYKIGDQFATGIITDNVRSTVLIGRSNSDIVYFSALTKSAVVPVSVGGTGATTAAGALTNLYAAIPVSEYSTPVYSTGVQALNANDGVRCIKYGNGMKRVIGVLQITGALNANGLLFTLPNDFYINKSNNGGIQIWTMMIGGTKSYRIRAVETDVYVWDYSPATNESYVIDFWYF